MSSPLAIALKECIPYKLLPGGLCSWLSIDDTDFTEPFFDETISRYRHRRENSVGIKCVSSIDILPEWSGHVESIGPAAFIFHISRCGSTLASQMLALSEENIVLSEVPFFDELLRHAPVLQSGHNSSSLLKAAIRLYGVKRNNHQCRLFIKTDSWHILFYHQLRELYPGVPFILLYRHPLEVIRSQQKRRGMQSVPGIIEPELFGLDRHDIMRLSLDEYMTRVLETYFQYFIDIAKKDRLAFPVNYKEGPIAVINKIAAVCSIPVDDDYRHQLRQRAGYHSKYPEQVFDEEKLQIDIPAYCEKVMSLYELLEGVNPFVPVVQDEPV